MLWVDQPALTCINTQSKRILTMISLTVIDRCRFLIDVLIDPFSDRPESGSHDDVDVLLQCELLP